MIQDGFQVLLVEDNPADARLLREVVAEAGPINLQLQHEDRLSKALARLDHEHFDVILLDLSLPDAEGLDTLVRTHAHAPSVPIVVLTGLDDEALAVAAVREGAQDYLVKGQVNSNLLVRAMRYATERKRAVEALQRSEEHFRALIENALDIITVLQPDGRIRYGSPSLERVLGYRPEEIQELSLLSFVHPRDQGTVRETLVALLDAPRTARSVEFRVRHRNGSWRVLEAIAKNVLEKPEVGGIVINCRDITERTEAESALHDANEKLHAVIQASPLAIYTLDAENRVKSWNPAAERIFGWSAQELLDQPLPTLVEEDQEQFLDRLRRARQGEPLTGFEVPNRRKDGSHVEVSIWTAALRDASGTGAGLVVAVADNTERKHLEEQFRQSQKMEAVGRLAGGVAHDFNNLLTVITGYCQMVLSGLSPHDPLAAEMEQVLKAADRAAGLTKQLLAFSRRQIVRAQVLDVNKLLGDMNNMLCRLIGEDIELRMTLQDGIGRIKADRGQIEQVIVNLVVNARDAMPKGGRLTIDTANISLDESYARQHLAAKPGAYVLIAVSDTGSGIEPKHLPHLFEPFFTTKEMGKGTGLGLSTSYGIVRQNGGNIYVYSEVGIGSTFKVYLPRVDEPAESAGAGAGGAQIVGGTETILVVEDEEGVRNVVQTMLQRLGYRVLIAGTPQEALSLFPANRAEIKMLMTDVVMPGMSGRDLADRLRREAADLPVLFVSGYTDNAVIHSGVLEPGMAFLQKPFSPEQLARKVREVLTAQAAD